MNLRKLKAFTLIELLVVIAIIGILAALIIVSLSGARGKAQDTQRKNNARNLDTGLAQYYLDQTTAAYPNNVASTAADGILIGSAAACTAPLDALSPNYLTSTTACGDPGTLVHRYATSGSGVNYSIGWGLASQTEGAVTTGNGVYAVASGAITVPTAAPDFTATSTIAGIRAFVTYGPQ